MKLCEDRNKARYASGRHLAGVHGQFPCLLYERISLVRFRGDCRARSHIKTSQRELVLDRISCSFIEDRMAQRHVHHGSVDSEELITAVTRVSNSGSKVVYQLGKKSKGRKVNISLQE